MNTMKEVKNMKYRIYISPHGGFDVYTLKNEGNGWSKTFHSHYDSREDAEQAVVSLSTQKMRG